MPVFVLSLMIRTTLSKVVLELEPV